MDKSWMKESRSSKAYIDGVSNFIKFALEKTSNDGAIYCPFRKCFNRYSFSSETVHEHLLWNGILEGYNRWVLHGESLLFPSNNQPNCSNCTSTSMSQSSADEEYDTQGLLEDAFGIAAQNQNNDNSNSMNDQTTLGSLEEIRYSPNCMEEHPQNESSSTIDGTNRLQQLMQDHDKELYPDCSKFSKLSFILRLYHLKCLHGWSEVKSESKWKQLGELAMSTVKLDMVEKCMKRATNLSGLWLLYSSLGDAEGISNLAALAKEQGKNNVALLCLFYVGKLEDSLQLLVESA